jgi:hypothetical protein
MTPRAVITLEKEEPESELDFPPSFNDAFRNKGRTQFRTFSSIDERATSTRPLPLAYVPEPPSVLSRNRPHSTRAARSGGSSFC